MITAIPTTPQNSTNGKYLVEIRTVSRLASYWASFVSRNRRVNARSRPNACTTRTPGETLLQGRRGCARCARGPRGRHGSTPAGTSGSPSVTGGTTIRMHSASCQLRMKITTSAPTKSSTFCTIEVRPCWTSSCIASTSDVMRATRRPVFSRSKKSRPRSSRWRNTRIRRIARRNVSPMRGDLVDRDPAEEQRAERHARDRARPTRSRAPAVVPRRPASIPCFTSAGPASRHAVCTGAGSGSRATIRRRHGRSIAAQPLDDPLRLVAREPVPSPTAAKRPPLARSRCSPTVAASAASPCPAWASTSRYRSDVSSSSSCVPSATHPTALEQHDPVGERDGRRAVGDDQRRPAGHHLAQRGADLVLLGRVDRRRRVVEDQHPRDRPAPRGRWRCADAGRPTARSRARR